MKRRLQTQKRLVQIDRIHLDFNRAGEARMASLDNFLPSLEACCSPAISALTGS